MLIKNKESQDLILEDLDPNAGTLRHRRQVTEGQLIKSGRHRDVGTIVLDPGAQEESDGIEFFQPVMESEKIVGIVHKCSCGKTSEVRFEYDHPSSAGKEN